MIRRQKKRQRSRHAKLKLLATSATGQKRSLYAPPCVLTTTIKLFWENLRFSAVFQQSMKSMDGRQDLVDERLKNYFLADCAGSCFPTAHRPLLCRDYRFSSAPCRGDHWTTFSDDLGVAPSGCSRIFRKANRWFCGDF